MRATLAIEYEDGRRAWLNIRYPVRIMLGVWWRLGTITHHAGRPVKRCRIHLIPPPFGEVVTIVGAVIGLFLLGAWIAVRGLG